MSEKRHASLDAKNTDTYQRNKKKKEEREKNRSAKSDEHSPATQQSLARERNLQGILFQTMHSRFLENIC